MLPRGAKECRDPGVWPPVHTNTLRQKMACIKQSEEKEILLLSFHRAFGRSCPLLLTVSAVKVAAFSSQTKCRMALCHRHLLNETWTEKEYSQMVSKATVLTTDPFPLPNSPSSHCTSPSIAVLSEAIHTRARKNGLC